MKKFINIVVLVLVLSGIAFQAWAMGEPPQDKLVTIGGKEFLIPADSGVIYDESNQALRFLLNAKTLEVYRAGEKKPGRKEKVDVQVVEVGKSIYGEKNFWPQPLKKWAEKECTPMLFEANRYKWCFYGSIGKNIQVWGENVYSLRNEKDQTLMVMGCSNPQISKVPNPRCEALGLMLDNIHIRHTYSVENYDTASEIDQAIRQIIFKFHTLATEKNNVIHTEPN